MLFVYSTLACLENNFVFNAFLRRVFFKQRKRRTLFKNDTVHSHSPIQSPDSLRLKTQISVFNFTVKWFTCSRGLCDHISFVYTQQVWIQRWLLNSGLLCTSQTSRGKKIQSVCCGKNFSLKISFWSSQNSPFWKIRIQVEVSRKT